MDPSLLVSVLSLLYQVYSDRLKRGGSSGERAPDPRRLDAIITDIRQEPEQALKEDGLAKRIDQEFNPEEAKQVKDDLRLLTLLVETPKLDAFDYWTLLDRYVSALRSLATKAKIFVLRGRKAGFGPSLELLQTAKALLTIERAEPGIMPHSRESLSEILRIRAYLVESTNDFPIYVTVTARFEEYSGLGYGSSSFNEDFGAYKVQPGQQKHWLSFQMYQTSSRFNPFEFMLSAADLKAVLQALSEDFARYIEDIQKDAAEFAKLRGQIDVLLEALSEPSTDGQVA